MDRRSIGAHELQAIDGERGRAVVRAVRQTSPTLADALTEFAFGQIFCKAELGRRERELATVAILGAIGGAETQLRVHLGAALRSGVDPDELIALCEHLAPYAGIPRALNVLREVRVLFEELDIVRPRAARRLDLGDHETVFSETGQGEPYVLIHSLGTDWRVWRDVVPLLVGEYRVIAYDMRGHGYASNAPKIEAMQTYVDDLVRLLDELNLCNVRIAGLSLGGCIAQMFALQHSDRVTSLALLSTMDRGAHDRYVALAESAERDGMAAQVAPTLLRWLTPEIVAENTWYVRYLRERIIRAQVPNWAAAWRTLAAFDVAGRLGELRIPTHVIAAGGDGQTTGPQAMKALAEHIPQAKFSVIAGAPHLSPLVKPHEVATLLSHR
jgi:3-oxoadipate enol-lactonase